MFHLSVRYDMTGEIQYLHINHYGLLFTLQPHEQIIIIITKNMFNGALMFWPHLRGFKKHCVHLVELSIQEGHL